MINRCKANPCCGEYPCTGVPRPQYRSGLESEYEREHGYLEDQMTAESEAVNRLFDEPAPPTRSFRLDPSSQAMAVIILDCINTLNQHNLTREEYLKQWATMCTKRLGKEVTVEQLETLAAQLGEVE